MTNKDDGMISFAEAVALIMQRTGRNRRQARAMLIEACRQGKIPATGTRLDNGQREIIPPEYFPKVH